MNWHYRELLGIGVEVKCSNYRTHAQKRSKTVHTENNVTQFIGHWIGQVIGDCEIMSQLNQITHLPYVYIYIFIYSCHLKSSQMRNIFAADDSNNVATAHKSCDL